MKSIFEFLDYREFMEQWFLSKKESNPRYSYRVFSRQMNQRSPSFLKDIIQKRRNLTREQQDRLCKIMGLSTTEGRYFDDMVTLDHSSESDKKRRAFERIAAARRMNGARRIEGDSYHYLSEWFHPAIRELAQRSDFQADPEWIAKSLRPKISKKQAKRALETLRELKMLTVDDSGKVHLSDGSLATPRQVAGIAVHNYHKEIVARATLPNN